MRCRKCQCPLVVLVGEIRKVCVRCGSVWKAEKNKQYREADPARAAAQDRQTYQRRREAKKQKAREYYAANKAMIMARRKARDDERWARVESILRGEQ